MYLLSKKNYFPKIDQTGNPSLIRSLPLLSAAAAAAAADESSFFKGVKPRSYLFFRLQLDDFYVFPFPSSRDRQADIYLVDL